MRCVSKAAVCTLDEGILKEAIENEAYKRLYYPPLESVNISILYVCI